MRATTRRLLHSRFALAMLLLAWPLACPARAQGQAGAVSPRQTPSDVEREIFSSSDVMFNNGEVKLAGTLTVPKGAGPHPAVVIITGSGGQDRDGALGLHGLYKLIAERLSASGVAALRVDDRGVGKSVMPNARPTSYRDLVSDTRAAFDYLHTRPEIDPKRIALVGHSEGALTAMIIAAEDPRVTAVALLAGASRPVDRVALEQALHRVALEELIDPSDRSRLPQIHQDILKFFDDARTIPKPNGGPDPYGWFREHAQIDPLAFARRVRCPALILSGERDMLVLPYHALELAQALAHGGNKCVRLRIFPDLTHIFTTHPHAAGEKAPQISENFLLTLQNWAADVLSIPRDSHTRKPPKKIF